MAAPAGLTQAQRADLSRLLTINDFLACWFIFPASVGLSGGLPPGGTPAQYRYIQRGDIAVHNLETMKNFTRAYAQLELARVGLTRAREDFTNTCQTAFMQAWNASDQQQPAGGINDIISTGWNTQPPAAMRQLPQWYITELNNLGCPAPVLVAPNVLNAANVIPAALPALSGAAGASPVVTGAGAPSVLPAMPAPLPSLLVVPSAATLAVPDPTTTATTTTTTVVDNDSDSDDDYEDDDDEGEEDGANEDEGEIGWETIDEEMQ